MSAAFEDGDAQRVVFDRRRAAAAIAHGDTRYPREAWKTNAPARRTLQFRAELYNALNSMQVSTVNTTATFDANGNQTNAAFGQVTAARDARRIQLALRFMF